MRKFQAMPSLRQIWGRFWLIACSDQWILLGRFCLIFLNYLIIFNQTQLFVAKFPIISPVAPILLLVYGLVCFLGPRFNKIRYVNFSLTLADIILISLGFYSFPLPFFQAAFVLYFVGIMLDVFYGGYLGSLLLTLLTAIGYSSAILFRSGLVALPSLYCQLATLLIGSLTLLLLSAKIKKSSLMIQLEKDHAKKQLHRLQAIAQITRETASGLNGEKLLHFIIQKALKLTRSKAGGFIYIDLNGVYRVKATQGLPQFLTGQAVDITKGLPSLIFKEKKSIISGNPDFTFSEQSEPILKPYQHLLAAPIWFKGEITGLIFLLSDARKTPYNQNDRLFIETLAEHTALGLIVSDLLQIADNLSLNDYLTGLGNARFFQEELGRSLALADRAQKHCSLMIVEIDNLKLLKEDYSSDQSIRIIRHLAELLKKNLRSSDYLARTAEGRFMILLPQTNFEETPLLENRIRESLTLHPFQYDEKTILVSITFGIASYPNDGINAVTLVSTAELTLHQNQGLIKN